MISYLTGRLMEIEEDIIVVECNGIGYGIRVPLSLLERLPAVGNQVKIHTYLQVKEDGIGLFGFLAKGDLKMFQQLLSVSGIGPKGALGVLSALTPDALRMAIVTGDAKAIARAPGIGNKTAQRVILELKDKISNEDLITQAPVLSGAQPEVSSGAAKEAVDALVALGYSGTEAAKAVKQVEITENMDSEAVLKASLKHLAFL